MHHSRVTGLSVTDFRFITPSPLSSSVLTESVCRSAVKVTVPSLCVENFAQFPVATVSQALSAVAFAVIGRPG